MNRGTPKGRIMIAVFAFLLLLANVAPAQAYGNELSIGYNPDHGLMVGAAIDLQKLTSLPLQGSFEAYTKKYNLFLTTLFPLEERLDFYLRPGLAEGLYLGMGVKIQITWDLQIWAGFGQVLQGDAFLDLLADYRLNNNLHLKFRYHMYRAYLGIGYAL
ncbi:MAG: hypothetical protein GX085_01665 [Firmicutes bacterium]|nr:hypothetical protein [Bacillota bacterium]